jgi:hypothetical protein
METTTTTQIILTTREQFPLWYDTIQEYAISYQIWEYCDPDTSQQAPSNMESTKIEAIRKLADRINSSVTTDFRVYLLQQHTPRAKLIALRKNLQITNDDQTSQIRAEFEALLKGQDKRTSTETYLSKWLHLSHRATQLAVANLHEQALCDGFIQASTDTNPIFFGQMKARRITTAQINKTQGQIAIILGLLATNAATVATTETELINNEAIRTALLQLNDQSRSDNLTMLECITLYRDTYPYTHSTKRTLNAAFGATLGDEKLPESKNDTPKRPKIPKTPCVCDNLHPYIKCWYLFRAAAPKDWEPKDETIAKVIAKLSGNAKLRKQVESHFTAKRLSLPDFWPSLTSTSTPLHSVNAITQLHAAYATATPARPFQRDSLFKLDSAATLHITNDQSRLTNFRTTTEQVLFGDTTGNLLGYGDLALEVLASNNQIEIINLRDVAYIPRFHFNIISTQRLEDSGFYFEPRRRCISNIAGESLYQIKRQNDFYTLEASKQNSAFAVESAPAIEAAPAPPAAPALPATPVAPTAPAIKSAPAAKPPRKILSSF